MKQAHIEQPVCLIQNNHAQVSQHGLQLLRTLQVVQQPP